MPVRRLTDIVTMKLLSERKKTTSCGGSTAPTVPSSRSSPQIKSWLLYQNISLLRRSRIPAFFVRSAESVPCPCCGGQLEVAGSRGRVWFKSSGDRSKLIIRRLRCAPCKRIHHELPDLLVPYKRYDAESIERVVSEPVCTDIAVEESTLRRWKCWFLAWAVYAAGCLQSVAVRFNLPVAAPSAPPQSALQMLRRFAGDAVGWLRRVVRPIANSNEWVTDPFRLLVRTQIG